MNARTAILLSLVLSVLGASSAPGAQTPADTTLTDLLAKAATVRDYHFRAQWESLGTSPAGAAEFWYAAPGRMRMVLTYAGNDSPASETLVTGDECYLLDPAGYDVHKRLLSELRGRVWQSPMNRMAPPYLTADYLRWWPRATVAGEGEAHGRRCQVVELAGGPALKGETRIHDDGFAEFIPQPDDPTCLRLWVDDGSARSAALQAGMVWRWEQRFHGESVGAHGEVTETQAVGGLLFPSAISIESGREQEMVRITDVAANQGVADDVFQFRLPPNWLMVDESLTTDQILRRLEEEPDNANLHYTLAGHYLESRPRRSEEAARECRRAIELAPEAPAAWLMLASALRQGPNGDPEPSIEAARRAFDVSGGTCWAALGSLATTLARAGRADEAIQLCRRALPKAQQPPYSHWVPNVLAMMLARQGDIEGAYHVLADLVPSAFVGLRRWASPARLLAWAEQSGHLDDLLHRVEAVVAAHPGSMEAQLLVVKVLKAQGRNAQALEALKALGPDFERDPWRGFEIVSLARDLGDEEYAQQVRRAVIKQCVASGHAWPDLWDGGGQAEAINELVAEAEVAYAAAADAESRAAVAENVRRIGRPVEIERVAHDALLARRTKDLRPAECAVVGALEFVMATGDLWPMWDPEQRLRAHAAACLERAVAAYPDTAPLWAMLGELRWSDARQEKIIWEPVADAYRHAAEADPDNVECAGRLALAEAHLGRCGDALAVARGVTESWPGEWATQALLAAVQINCEQAEQARDVLPPLMAAREVREEWRHRTAVGDLLVRAHEALGELDRAEAVLKQDIADGSGEPVYTLHQRLLDFYRRHDRPADAYATARALHFCAPHEWMQQEAVKNALELFEDDPEGLAAAIQADLAAHPGEAGPIRFGRLVHQRAGGPPEAARALRAAAAHAAADLQAGAGDSPDAWRDVADMHLLAEAWEDALAAAERAAALTPEDDETALMRADILAARAYAGKRDDHEARRRLFAIVTRSDEPTVLREAADALVDLYLLRDERDQAIATLNDLRLRTDDWQLQGWIDRRLKNIGEAEGPGGD